MTAGFLRRTLRGMTAKKAEMIEGREAFERFRETTKAILAVPHAIVQQRIAEHRSEAAKNPHRRGPKAKAK